MRNPFRYCPHCGETPIDFTDQKRFSCSRCGFVYFHNIATATGALLEYRGQLVLLKRNLEPALGLWDLPGGFVDPSESAEEAVVRECREEIRLEPENLHYLMSLPNTYRYREVDYRTCDFFFTGTLSRIDFVLQKEEVSELITVSPENCPIDRIAFPSVEKAVRSWMACKSRR